MRLINCDFKIFFDINITYQSNQKQAVNQDQVASDDHLSPNEIVPIEHLEKAISEPLLINEHPLANDLLAKQIEISLIEPSVPIVEVSENEVSEVDLAKIIDFQGSIIANANTDTDLMPMFFMAFKDLESSQDSFRQECKQFSEEELVLLQIVVSSGIQAVQKPQTLSDEQFKSALENYFVEKLPDIIKNVMDVNPQHLANLKQSTMEKQNLNLNERN